MSVVKRIPEALLSAMRENCQNNKHNDVVYAPFGGKTAAKS
jgi:hypothetical protein